MDFISLWAETIRKTHNQPRVWVDFAGRYDEVVPHSPEIVAALRALVRPDDTLLDIGAGTGRFALPLAAHVRHITALDRSEQMLATLERKAAAQGITNIETLQSRWAEAQIAPHDVVLAAFVPGPQEDIAAQLGNMAEAARRTLIVIQGDPSAHAPHHTARQAIWPNERRDLPKYLIYAGMLWQIGLRADVRVLHEHRRYHAQSPQDIARQLAPLQLTDETLARFTEAIMPLLTHDAAGYHYDYRLPAGLIIWQRA